MNDLHSLLRRQLKRYFGTDFLIPEDWKGFIRAVNEAYMQSDSDRTMLERSLDLSSQELLEANAQSRAVFHAMPDLFFWIEKDGKILDCKAGSDKDLFIPRKELIGKMIQDAPGPVSSKKFMTALESVDGSQSVVSVEYTLVIQGEKKFYEARIVPVLEGNMIVIVRNITERVKAMQELKETQSMLIHAGKLTAIGQLGAGIAHELNQPLTAIRGYAQLILERLPATDPIKEDLLRIEEQTGRMGKIINNIRTFARESGREFSSVDLRKTINDSFMLMKAQLQNDGIEVDVDLPIDLPAVWAEPSQMQQVFVNLITNSRDALEGAIGGRISVKSSCDKEHVLISFMNNGPPISEKVREQIFDPFFTTKGSGDGMGLGLSISYGIIKDHHGEIHVRAGSEKGVEFTIKLPVFK